MNDDFLGKLARAKQDPSPPSPQPATTNAVTPEENRMGLVHAAMNARTNQDQKEIKAQSAFNVAQLLDKHDIGRVSFGHPINKLFAKFRGGNVPAHYNPVTGVSIPEDARFPLDQVLTEIPHAIQEERSGTLPFVGRAVSEFVTSGDALGLLRTGQDPRNRYREKGTQEYQAHGPLEDNVYDQIRQMRKAQKGMMNQ